jgi:hypothetical protein
MRQTKREQGSENEKQRACCHLSPQASAFRTPASTAQ